MSQKKVDAYKKEKRNRKKNLAREKRMKVVRSCIAILCICLLAGIVYYIAKNPSDSTTSTTQADKELLQQELLEQLTENGASVTSGDSDTTVSDDTASDDTASGDNGSENTDSSDADSENTDSGDNGSENTENTAE
ncbi:MAG: hypothetical protein PUB10_08745 [Clostridiales bacterium]|nr:hypothetical protein [Clostridiales bacterium]